mmetsp:Transcript_8603/g.14531  ORF Transcript_8603/g.14531 Transcript_8603/m.14531 type:complete len:278 (-) Transcript_8603:55-888(-)
MMLVEAENDVELVDRSKEELEMAKQRIVLPGDFIGEGLIAGHGTYEKERDEKIYASIAGVVHQIDKVVCVKPLRQGYRPDIGDVVVGRVVQVDQKRWIVDINSYQHAILNLSSINLPGGVQRRRNEEDQLNMRQHFKEGDMICAEVMQVNSNDGRILLQSRNERYGKLLNGFLTQIDSNYIRRQKSHILEFESKSGAYCRIRAILGVNGYIWIFSPVQELSNQVRGGSNLHRIQQAQILKSVGRDERLFMASLRKAIHDLVGEGQLVYKDSIEKRLD